MGYWVMKYYSVGQLYTYHYIELANKDASELSDVQQTTNLVLPNKNYYPFHQKHNPEYDDGQHCRLHPA